MDDVSITGEAMSDIYVKGYVIFSVVVVVVCLFVCLFVLYRFGRLHELSLQQF